MKLNDSVFDGVKWEECEMRHTNKGLETLLVGVWTLHQQPSQHKHPRYSIEVTSSYWPRSSFGHRRRKATANRAILRYIPRPGSPDVWASSWRPNVVLVPPFWTFANAPFSCSLLSPVREWVRESVCLSVVREWARVWETELNLESGKE